MNLKTVAVWAIVVQAVWNPPSSGASETIHHPQPAASTELLEGLEPATWRPFLAELLEHNPDVARARARATAAELRAPQVRSLDDPVAALTLFLLPPETRVGPQRLTLSLSQKLPWFGKLERREQAALYAAAAVATEVERQRLAVLTEARRALAEVWFLDRHEAITREEREHLIRHEEAARARYTAGMGLQQAAIKIQAEITRAEQRLLTIAERRLSLVATINALGDRAPGEPIEVPALIQPQALELEPETLQNRARERRPEIQRAHAEIGHGQTLIELAELSFRPDFNVGFGYTLVDGRRDAAGRANPPSDDGDDILSLSAGVHLPVRRAKREAALAEATELRRAAEEGQRAAWRSIERDLGERIARLPLLYRQWTLFQNVLLAQAEEALRSAEAAYTTGKIGALDLLDAEHVLFEVRTAAARAHADYAITLAELEAAVASPLSTGLLSSAPSIRNTSETPSRSTP